MFRILSFALLLGLTGCSDRPKAPALTPSPILTNTRGAFRLTVPSDWRLLSRGELPPGKLEQTRTIASYSRTDGDSPAGFQVSAVDAAPLTAVVEMLTNDRTEGTAVWRSHAAEEAVEAGGVKGTRVRLHSGTGKEKGAHIRDIYVFERGDLIWMFGGIYAPTDSQARDAVRRAVDSLEWK